MLWTLRTRYKIRIVLVTLRSEKVVWGKKMVNAI